MTRPVEPARATVVWSQEVRSWVSLVLFAHLFAVCVGMVVYTRPSGLQDSLNSLFGPYLRAMYLAPYPANYPVSRFHLTHALPTDVDYAVTVEIAGEPPRVFALPPEGGIWPGARQRRFQALANAAGTIAADDAEELGGILPKAIGGAVLRRENAEQATVKLRAHYLPDMEELVQGPEARKRALEKFTDVYEAQVFISGGTTELLKKSSTQEVAPVERRPNRPAAPQP